MSERETEQVVLTTFARSLRTIRANRDMTRAEVAERAGLATESVARYERGEGNPRVDTIARLAAVLDVDAYHLLSVDEIRRTSASPTPENPE